MTVGLDFAGYKFSLGLDVSIFDIFKFSLVYSLSYIAGAHELFLDLIRYKSFSS